MSALTRQRGLVVSLIDAIVVAGLVVVASLAFGAAYGGTRWLVACAGGALVGALIGLLAARLRWHWGVGVLAVFGGYLAFGAALAVPATAIAGAIPSVESLRQLTVGVVTSWRQLLTVSVPVGTSGAVMIPIYLTAVVTASVGAWIAIRTRRPLWALTAPLAMMLVAALFGATSPWLPIVAGVAVTVLGLGWASWRLRGSGGPGLDMRRPISATVVLAAVVASGLLVGAHVQADDRYALRTTVDAPFDPQVFPSPLAGFRKYFKEEKDSDLFTVGGLPDGARIRLAVMDDYNGVTFNASTASGAFIRVGDRIDDPAAGQAVTIDVTIDDYRGVYLPGAGHLSGVSFESVDGSTLRDGFRYSGGNAAAVVIPGLVKGDTYRASVTVPPPADGLNLVNTPVQRVTLPAPQRIPDAIKSAAGKFTENATSAYEKVVALQKGLSDQGFLSHGTEGEEPSASGHGIDRLSRLLGDTEMVGDQEQFAPAMALMLRSVNIPARVVMGFIPPTEPDGNTIVRGSDVTAWVEVPFDGVGWVAFDPTPNDQRTAPEPDPEPEVAPRAQVLQPPPPPQPPQDANAADVDQGNTDDPKDDQDKQDEESNGILGVLLAIGLWVGIPLLIIGIPVGLILWFKARRRNRRRSAAVLSDRISGGWAQIVDSAADLGYRAPSRLTRSEAAAQVDQHLGGSTALLARRADARIFGPEAVDEAEAERFWTDVDAAQLGLTSGLSLLRRWRAALSISSLWPRRR